MASTFECLACYPGAMDNTGGGVFPGSMEFAAKNFSQKVAVILE